jgi:hypothetical protein
MDQRLAKLPSAYAELTHPNILMVQLALLMLWQHLPKPPTKRLEIVEFQRSICCKIGTIHFSKRLRLSLLEPAVEEYIGQAIHSS